MAEELKFKLLNGTSADDGAGVHVPQRRHHFFKYVNCAITLHLIPYDGASRIPSWSIRVSCESELFAAAALQVNCNIGRTACRCLEESDRKDDSVVVHGLHW